MDGGERRWALVDPGANAHASLGPCSLARCGLLLAPALADNRSPAQLNDGSSTSPLATTPFEPTCTTCEISSQRTVSAVWTNHLLLNGRRPIVRLAPSSVASDPSPVLTPLPILCAPFPLPTATPCRSDRGTAVQPARPLRQPSPARWRL